LIENPVLPPERPAGAEVPERIGKYDVVRPLGKGAMGVVYHARDSLLDRDVALKVMLRQFAADPEQKHRFEREARAVAKLMHPNVVLVFDLGYHTDRSPYIAMELLQGQDLLQALRQGIPLPLDRKVSIILQVLDGLGHAHNSGIVHRDIKPANIFICQDGTVKIMDFGVARFTAASVTATGIVLGTANYMSPEQVEGVKVDGRSDVFSVGSVLFELLVGRKPFQAESLMKTLFKIAHDEPTMTLPPGPENEALRPILQKAMAKKADERYQTAADFAFALREYLMTVGAGAASAAVVTPPPEPVAEAHVREPTIDLRAAPMVAPEPAPAPATDPSALFKLMREIYLGRKSGHLHFTHGKERRSLLIHGGRILHGTSDVLGEHLGDVLVRYGLLDQRELNQATKVVLRDRKRLGIVLGEQGLMDTERLSNAVSLHVREILFNVAERGGVSSAFEETATDDLAGDSAASKLSTVEMILETARRVQDPSVVGRVLGDLDRVLVASDNPQLRFQNIALTPTEGFVMSRIDGTLTAREVFTLIPLPPEDTERSLFVLLCTGAVEHRTTGAREAPGSGARAARAAAAAAASPAPAAAPPATPPAAASASPVAPPPAPATPAPASGSADTVQQHGARVRQLLEARRQLIVNAYEAMATKNHFEFLGVPRTATEVQVKEAYFRLARPLHPDSNRDPGLSDIQDKREAAFHRLSQAYETLRDPQKRGRYEADLDARAPKRRPEPTPPPPPDPGPAVRTEADRLAGVAAALESARQAEKLYKEEKYWDAIQLLERAIPRLERGPKLKAQVLLARAFMKNPNWGRRAEELLQRVLQDSPDYADAYVTLGNLYRASQLKSRAQAMYRKAVQAQPGHAEALAELASLDGEGPPDGPTRLKKFFSKS
jgi:tetratricopeptide (TPR) repeat protein